MPYAALVLLEGFYDLLILSREQRFPTLFFLGCLQERQGYRPAGLDLHAPGFSFGCRGCIMQMRGLPGKARLTEIVIFKETLYSNVA
jgi:hypothetical protein